jgi:hypothetical protein
MSLTRLRLFLLLAVSLLLSLKSDAAPGVPYWNITIKDGLPGNFVYTIMEDSRGFIWIATNKGLARFDGYSFKVFDVSDGLEKNDVYGTYEDRRGRIFALSFSRNLAYIENDSVKILHSAAGTLLKPISLSETEKGIYFNATGFTGGDFFYESGDSIKRVTYTRFADDVMPGDSAHHYRLQYFRSPNELLLLDHKGLRRIDLPTGKVLESRPLLLPVDSNLVPERSWLAGNDYVLLAFRQVFVVFHVPDFSFHVYRFSELCGQPEMYIRNFQASLRELVVSGSGGMILIDKSTFKSRYIPIDFLPEGTQLWSQCLDQKQNLWITSKNSGVYFVSNMVWRNGIRYLPGLRTGTRYEACKPTDGPVQYYTSYNGDIYALDTALRTKLVLQNDNDEGYASDARWMVNCPELNRSFIFYPSDYYRRRCKVLDNRTGKITDFKKLYRFDNEGSEDDLIARYMASTTKAFWVPELKALLLIFRTSTGLLSFRDSRTVHFEMLDTRRNDLAVYDSAAQRIWLGGPMGLYYYSFAKGGKPVASDFVLPMGISTMAILGEGRYLVANEKKGLLLLPGVDGKPHELGNLNHESIRDLTVRNDSIWIGTDQAIYLAGISGLNTSEPVLEKRIRLNNSRNVLFEGLNSLNLSGNHLIVATDNGILSIPADLQLSQGAVPRLYFTGIRIDDKPVPWRTMVQLKHNTGNLEINFVGVDLERLGNIRYAYKLTGVDKNWVVTRNRSARYVNLPPGDYTFQLSYLDDNGKVVLPYKQLIVTVNPAWWQSWWGRSLFVLFTLLVVLWMFRVHIAQLRKEQEEQQQHAEAYSRLELHALQSQMNPHFVFNALNAIKYYLRMGDQKMAENYLTKFAQLIRKFLDASKARFIGLDNEIDLLRKYTELEQMRFRDKFDVHWDIDESLETFSLRIPAMIIQPFIENAVNHGVFHRREKGNIWLRFKDIDHKEYMVVIEDDGIGREAARKLREELYSPSHKSVAMQNINDRIALINRSHLMNIRVNVIDKQDAEGNPIGTRVEVMLPQIHS